MYFFVWFQHAVVGFFQHFFFMIEVEYRVIQQFLQCDFNIDHITGLVYIVKFVDFIYQHFVLVVDIGKTSIQV